MRVYLDGEPLQSEPTTFAEALRGAVAAAESRGRIVVEATLDGQPVTDAMLDSPPEGMLAGELRCTTAEPRSLVRVTLLDAADALETTRSLQQHSADLVQTGKTIDALPPLGEAVATWQAVRDAVERGATLLAIPLADVRIAVGGETFGPEELIAQLSDRLQELRRALAGEDWSAVGDVLAYDMAEQVDRWKALLTELAERAGRTG